MSNESASGGLPKTWGEALSAQSFLVPASVSPLLTLSKDGVSRITGQSKPKPYQHRRAPLLCNSPPPVAAPSPNRGTPHYACWLQTNNVGRHSKLGSPARG